MADNKLTGYCPVLDKQSVVTKQLKSKAFWVDKGSPSMYNDYNCECNECEFTFNPEVQCPIVNKDAKLPDVFQTCDKCSNPNCKSRTKQEVIKNGNGNQRVCWTSTNFR